MNVVAVLLVVAVVVVTGLLAYASHRRHARAAQARSRAALNRLLAEADELAQRQASDSDDEHP